MKKNSLILMILVFFTPIIFAAPITLNPHHPQRYVVKKGDTLWDISEKFLKDPWAWPQIWRTNPYIHNPHLIYPGDILILSYHHSQPYLTVQKKHSHFKAKAIPPIALRAIKPFLTHSRVFKPGELAKAPYLVAVDENHLAGIAGEKIYVRQIEKNKIKQYTLFRKGEPYLDPETGKILGIAATYIGDAALTQAGDPATLSLISTTQEALVGDRLFPLDQNEFQLNFYPHPPKANINGTIIAVLGGVTQIGQYQVVVINRGKLNGMTPGDVLTISSYGKLIRDSITTQNELVKLPDQPVGQLIVFRTFDQVSYGLVMRAKAALHIFDKVSDPRQTPYPT